MAAENSADITEINYILKYIKNKTVILNCNNILPYYFFTLFLIKEMQPSWDLRHKRLVSETSYQPQTSEQYCVKVKLFIWIHYKNYYRMGSK